MSILHRGTDGNPQRFLYTVTGSEGDLTELTITLPADRGGTNYEAFPAMVSTAYAYTMMIKSKTSTTFVLSLSAAASMNDVFDFLVVDKNA